MISLIFLVPFYLVGLDLKKNKEIIYKTFPMKEMVQIFIST